MSKSNDRMLAALLAAQPRTPPRRSIAGPILLTIALIFLIAAGALVGSLYLSRRAGPMIAAPAPLLPAQSAPRPGAPPAPVVDVAATAAAYNGEQFARATAYAVQDAPAEPPAVPTPAPAWHAPMAADFDVCAAWHAPLPWPPECQPATEGWHAPLKLP